MDQKDTGRIIEMAWEDRTPFETIRIKFDFSENDVVALMRKELKRSSFNFCRERLHSGISKKKIHKKEIRRYHVLKASCKNYYHEKISKR